MPAPTKDPIAARRFKAALELKAPLAFGDRKLLALLGAYADGGEQSPPARELARRLGMTVEEIDASLARLSKQRLIWVDYAPFKHYREATYPRSRHRRNRYYLRFFDGDACLPEAARRVIFSNSYERDGVAA
jgi:hypothetical protein